MNLIHEEIAKTQEAAKSTFAAQKHTKTYGKKSYLWSMQMCLLQYNVQRLDYLTVNTCLNSFKVKDISC